VLLSDWYAAAVRSTRRCFGLSLLWIIAVIYGSLASMEFRTQLMLYYYCASARNACTARYCFTNYSVCPSIQCPQNFLPTPKRFDI